MSDTDGASASFQVLQGLILPEPELCDEMALYLRLQGGVHVAQGILHCEPAAILRGDTYYSLFNIGKWRRQCALSDLALRVQGRGRFEVTIWCATACDVRRLVVTQMLTLEAQASITLPIDLEDTAGVLYYEIRSLGAGQITALDWVTIQSPVRAPQLMLSVTTYKREAAVARTAERFAAFIADSPLADRITLLIVDNGASAEIAPARGIEVIQNENLGGSGGFARGLLAARARGASHCLFMDDDAAIHMQSLERTWTFLAYATDPATAVIGGISSGRDPAVLWENGAVFNSRCRPCYNGVDLRAFSSVLEMELETTLPPPQGHYGGWWYFAFPVDHAPHMPFPFFVRGDDISFSLVNRFNAVTLPGVLCFQDLDFSERESPLTLYLDLRSHLAHHMALPEMALGRWRTARIAAWFFARSLCGCHYETLAALNLAIEDALKGPDFFAQNADMAQRRSDIAALRHDELWRDLPLGAPLPDTSGPANPMKQNSVEHLVMKFTLNGHLLPFFSRWGRSVTLRARHRGSLGKLWGASQITYVDTQKRQTYTVHHNKRAMLREGGRMISSMVRLVWRYDSLCTQWRTGYDGLTRGDFWERRLGMSESTAKPAHLSKPLRKN
ncbi:glycosyltransferase [uncultured Sulfitobacter sp.]|uniref:glycosyltransferase n=1 Tax=uncultured Sulfitobacter sp. TaxID=191468 RepID=UPI00262B2BB5|nr:glycosyltransferase [uncultured Sulfitobacter sp.]